MEKSPSEALAGDAVLVPVELGDVSVVRVVVLEPGLGLFPAVEVVTVLRVARIGRLGRLGGRRRCRRGGRRTRRGLDRVKTLWTRQNRCHVFEGLGVVGTDLIAARRIASPRDGG